MSAPMPTPALTEHLFADAAELVSGVIAEASASPSPLLWFRGQGCQDHELLPKLCRESQPMEKVREREGRLLARFRERSFPYFPQSGISTEWEHLFSMQHHGVPTRLLDWTETLLVAAYFAVTSPPDPKHTDPGHTCQPTVWLLRPVEWNRSIGTLKEAEIAILTQAHTEAEKWAPQTLERRFMSPMKVAAAMYGVHNNARIVAQRGTFTVMGSDEESLESQSTGDRLGTLTKFVLNGERADLRENLRLLGVTKAMVYPELASVAADLTELEGWADA